MYLAVLIGTLSSAAFFVQVADSQAPRLELSATAFEVGQPLDWDLVLEHGVGESVVLSEAGAPQPGVWVVLEERAPEVSALPDQGRLQTRFGGRVVCLSPGEQLFTPPVVLREGEPILLEPRPVLVAGVLADGEQQARPLRGFRPIFEETPAERGPWPWLLGGSLLLALLGGRLWRARSRQLPAVAAPTALARLARLEPAFEGGEQELRAAHFELAALLRSGVEEWLGSERPALTDEEWMRSSAQAGLDAGVGDQLALVLERCSAVRWAGESPTSWAARETVRQAREVLEGLERSRPVLTTGGVRA